MIVFLNRILDLFGLPTNYFFTDIVALPPQTRTLESVFVNKCMTFIIIDIIMLISLNGTLLLINDDSGSRCDLVTITP
jgi:hypothetical protein